VTDGRKLRWQWRQLAKITVVTTGRSKRANTAAKTGEVGLKSWFPSGCNAARAVMA